MLEERLHIDHQVFEHRQAEDRLDLHFDVIARAEILDQRFAGELILPVDAHRVRAAYAVRARAAQGERAVLLPLDAVKQFQHAVGGFHVLEGEFLPVGLILAGDFRVEPSNSERYFHSVIL